MNRVLALCCFALVLSSGESCAQSRFNLVKPEVVKARLDLYKGSDKVRGLALFNAFTEAGCSSANLSQQIVLKRKEPNILCVLPGETSEVILVGAHFDHVAAGDGIVDNWSGASLLPSLFQSLVVSKRRHTFVFAGFTGEEDGEVGSDFYVRQLSKVELAQIALMVTIDTIGLGPTKVWASRSDKYAVGVLGATASVLKLPLAVVNMDGFGESDEEPFLKKQVKTITIHSLTPATTSILHSRRDAPSAISFHDYYDTFHLLAGYLAILDTQVGSPASDTMVPPR